MKIADLFETRVEEKIEPVIKVGERGDEHKLAAEIGSYVLYCTQNDLSPGDEYFTPHL